MPSKKVDLNVNHSVFADLLMNFAPTIIEIDGKTPDEIISTTSNKAFALSIMAALPPGPFGMATILPEILVIYKLQLNMVYKIAKFYNQEHKINPTILCLILANEAGVEFGKEIIVKVGPKYVIRALSSQALKPIITKISTKVTIRVTEKLFARWIPVVAAPIFGAISKSMTNKIGQKAIDVFSKEIEIEEENTKTCSNGHIVLENEKFCHTCGELINKEIEYNCPNGHIVNLNDHFCQECGVKIEINDALVCSQGHEIHLLDKFCPECGEEIKHNQ